MEGTRVAVRSPEVLCDQVVDAQSRRPDAAVLVEALEIDRVLAFDDLARLAEQEAVHLARVRCPRVEESPSRLSAKDNAPRPSTHASAFSLEVRAQPMNPWTWFVLSTAKQ